MNTNQQTQHVSHPVGMTPGTVPAQFSNQPWANSAHAAPSTPPYPSPHAAAAYPTVSPHASAVDETLVVTGGADAIPAGAYEATFVAYEGLMMTSQFSEGPQEKRRLIFQISRGPYAGKRCDLLCNATFSAKSTLFKWAVALLGRQLNIGESFNFSQLIGKRFSLILQTNERGYSKIIAAVPLDPPQQ